MRKFVGLSLSFCVKEILQGMVKEEQVECIIPGFDWAGKPDNMYYSIYWAKWSKEEVDALLARLNIRNRETRYPANISQGSWMDASDFTWEKYFDQTCRLRTEDIVAMAD